MERDSETDCSTRSQQERNLPPAMAEEHHHQRTYPNPISPGQTRIGWIGTGIMGAAMAGRLQSSGYSLVVFNRTPSKAADLIRHGATLAASPADVASRSDVVFLMVSAPSDVRSVVLEPETGLLYSLPRGGVIVDMTSSSPALAREIASAAASCGCWAIDAPVSGGDTGAREGKLAILAGGDAAVVEWLSPLFELMGKATHVGGAGCGHSSKLANQIAGGGNVLGLSEALVFAAKAGLDVPRFFAAIRAGAAGSNAAELFGERMVARDFDPGGFAEYMLKDFGMALQGFGDGEVVSLPGTALLRELFQAMVANGDGKMGLHGLLTVIERISGGIGR